MKQIKFAGLFSIALISAMFIGALFTGCPTEVEEVSGDAKALTITVAGKDVILPEPHKNWWDAEIGQVTIDPGFALDAAIEVTAVESGSRIRYAKVEKLSDDPVFEDTATFTLANNNYVYVEIKASGGNVLYYFFQVKLIYTNISLNSVTIGGVKALLGDPAPEATFAGEGTVTFTPDQVSTDTPLDVAVVKGVEAQTLRFAKAVPGPDAPVFTPAPDPLSYVFNNGDYLYIEVTDAEGVFKYVYKIKVIIASNVATLMVPIKFGDVDDPVFQITTLATAKLTYSLTPGDITTVTNPTELGAVEIFAMPTETDATVKFAVSRSEPGGEPSFGTQSSFQFNYGSTWLDILVTAPNGIDKRYYRYRINIGKSVNTLTVNSLTITKDSTTITANPTGANVNPLSATAIAVNTLTEALAGAAVSVTPTDADATVQYAITKDVTDLPEYGALTSFDFSLTNTWLFVRVTAQNGVFTNYRFKVSGSTVNTLQNGTQVTIGGTGYAFGTPNTASTQATAVNVDVSEALTGAAVSATPTADSGAVVKYAITKDAATLPVFGDASSFNFTGSTYLYVQVTAVSGDATYYRFLVRAGNNDASLSSFTIGGTSYTPGTPNATATSATAVPVVFAAPITSTTVVAVPTANTTTVRYAITEAAATAPVYGTANTFSFGLGQLRWLYVEVTPQNGAVTHYRFQVSVPMISSVSIGGNPVTNLGTADATFSGATAGSTVTLTDAAAATNLTIVATPPSGLGITVLYGTSTTAGTEPTNWSASLPSEQIPSGTYIGVKASAETTVNYYKFRITYGSNAFAVSAVTVAGKAPNSLGTPGTAYNTGVTVANIYLTSAQVTPGRQIVVTSANAVSIRVGTSTSNNTAPNNWVTLTKSGNTYTANLPGNALANNSTRIALEVTAEDNITIRFYKFLVMTANNAALTSLSVGGVSAAAANWGTPAGSWDTPNLVTGGTPLTLTSGAATNAVVIAAGGTNAGTITYAKTSDLTTEPLFAAAPEGGFTFANGDYLYVRLVYTTASNIYRNVYRIPIAVQ